MCTKEDTTAKTTDPQLIETIREESERTKDDPYPEGALTIGPAMLWFVYRLLSNSGKTGENSYWKREYPPTPTASTANVSR